MFCFSVSGRGAQAPKSLRTSSSEKTGRGVHAPSTDGERRSDFGRKSVSRCHFSGRAPRGWSSRSTAVRLEDAVVEEKRTPACMREVVVDKARSVLAAPRSRRGALTEREGADAIMMQSLLGEKKKPPHASVSYIEEAKTWRGASLPLLPARGESAGVGHGREECCS